MRTARITAGSAASERRRQNRERRKRQHGQVGGLHLVEQRLDVSHRRHAERQARERSHQHHGEDIHGHPPRDVAGLRADRHANADFAPPLQHGVVEHAVQADAREQQRDRREEQRQHRQQPLADGLRAGSVPPACGCC